MGGQRGIRQRRHRRQGKGDRMGRTGEIGWGRTPLRTARAYRRKTRRLQSSWRSPPRLRSGRPIMMCLPPPTLPPSLAPDPSPHMFPVGTRHVMGWGVGVWPLECSVPALVVTNMHGFRHACASSGTHSAMSPPPPPPHLRVAASSWQGSWQVRALWPSSSPRGTHRSHVPRDLPILLIELIRW